jgi:hypothetical protein
VRFNGHVAFSASTDDGCATNEWSLDGDYDSDQLNPDLTICDYFEWLSYVDSIPGPSASNCYGGIVFPCTCPSPPDNECSNDSGSAYIRAGVFCTESGPDGAGWYFYVLVDAISGCFGSTTGYSRLTFALDGDTSPWGAGPHPAFKYKDIGADYTKPTFSVPLVMYPGLGFGGPVPGTGSCTFDVAITAA